MNQSDHDPGSGDWGRRPVNLIDRPHRLIGRIRTGNSPEGRLCWRAARLGLRLHHLAPTGALARRLGPFYLTSDRMDGAVVGYALADLNAVAAFLAGFRQWQG